MIETSETLFTREAASDVPAAPSPRQAIERRPSAELPPCPDQKTKGSLEAISTLGAIAIAILLAAYATTRIGVRPKNESASASIRSSEMRVAPNAQLALPTIVRLANGQFPSEPLKLE